MSTFNWKNVDLTNYEERLKTFQDWKITFIKPEDLAKAGLFYTGNESDDAVECYSCQTALAFWERGDDPQNEHKKASPNCPFLLNPNKTNQGLPKLPEFATFDARFKTFDSNWRYKHQTPFDLADAGFLYSGYGDRCECYYCGVVLKDWQTDDDPWKEHAYWSPGCNYVTLVKGEKFIIEICDKKSIRDQNSNSINIGSAPTIEAY